MSAPQRILAMVGSPKAAGKSTSDSLATYLLDLLEKRGLQVDKLHVGPAIKAPDGPDGLLARVDEADAIVLVAPLYVDSLPSSAIRALELIADHRASANEPGRQLFAAIINSGFPEAAQMDVAIAICRQFAREVGFEWAGGLGLGGGGTVDGRPLAQVGGPARHATASLQLAAEALAQGQALPQEAVDLMATPAMPKWLYVLGGNIGWKLMARKNKVTQPLNSRPYKR